MCLGRLVQLLQSVLHMWLVCRNELKGRGKIERWIWVFLGLCYTMKCLPEWFMLTFAFGKYLRILYMTEISRLEISGLLCRDIRLYPCGDIRLYCNRPQNDWIFHVLMCILWVKHNKLLYAVVSTVWPWEVLFLQMLLCRGLI